MRRNNLEPLNATNIKENILRSHSAGKISNENIKNKKIYKNMSKNLKNIIISGANNIKVSKHIR